jgi:hypothetical protein
MARRGKRRDRILGIVGFVEGEGRVIGGGEVL